MARRVLGNDPFKTGAAPRTKEPSLAAAEQPAAPAPGPAHAAVPASAAPEAPVQRVVKSKVAAQPPGRLAQRTPPEIVAHAESPVGVVLSGSEPLAHFDSPGAGADPVPHAHSPGFASDPVPHAHSPEGSHLPIAHSESPVIAADPTPHQGSPVSRPLPQPHQGSPDIGADPTPHQGSPSGRVVAVAEEEPGAPLEEFTSPGPEPVAPFVGARPFGRAQTLALAKTLLESGVSLPVWGAARGLFQAARSGLGLGAVGDLDAWGKDVALTASLEPLAGFLFDRYWRIAVQGAERLPRGPSLIVANHSGALPLDGPMLRYALERSRADLPQARWLVEDQLFHSPFFGLLAARLGAVRANPENALRLLADGQTVIVFPEGIHGLTRPFAERYQLRRFGRGGFVKIALRAGVPIVPVALVGGDEAMPMLAKLPSLFGLPHLPLTTPPLPAKWFIRFGKPIDLSKARAGAEDDLAFVQRENERTRDMISGLLTALLEQRESVF